MEARDDSIKQAEEAGAKLLEDGVGVGEGVREKMDQLAADKVTHFATSLYAGMCLKSRVTENL